MATPNTTNWDTRDAMAALVIIIKRAQENNDSVECAPAMVRIGSIAMCESEPVLGRVVYRVGHFGTLDNPPVITDFRKAIIEFAIQLDTNS